MQIESLLQAVKDGKMDIAEAKQMLSRAPYEDLGFAKLDTHRSIRTGFAEVVYCQNKADDFLVKIFCKLYQTYGEVMGTRCSAEQFEVLKKHLPDLSYDPISRIAKIEQPKKRIGFLASVIGGLVANPVIAVPTSVGYGANFHGLSALLTMINSCSNGVATVNIDNGFGAGFLASQINRLATQKE